MNIINRVYAWFLKKVSRPGERERGVAGYWQGKVRNEAVRISSSYQGRILEAGCGSGVFLSRLVAANPNVEVWGVDSDPAALQKAQELFKSQEGPGPHFFKTDIGTLPFEDSFFDAVVCINLLICLDAMGKVKGLLKEMLRVLKPGGRLILEFRNQRCPLLGLKYGLARFYDETITRDEHPLSTYKNEEILSALKESGFKVLQERFLDFPIKKFAPLIILEAQKNV